jgi:DNA-binding XRE family transcriptional regulator
MPEAFFSPAALRTARRAADLSFAGLAELTGRSTWLLRCVETGKTLPSLLTAYTIAKALDVDVISLYAGSPETAGIASLAATHYADDALPDAVADSLALLAGATA